ncbi:hypothetical protein MP228_009341 [Amoeboaphelidium protococcarum]|nr:hypothetical protein MP228_009341 [Amoeboaphelidium protococcarum]
MSSQGNTKGVDIQSPEEHLRLVSHPLVAHKMSLLRDKRTKPRQFRDLVKEISQILAINATDDLDLMTTKQIMTPLDVQFDGVKVKDKIGIFPILRAGLGMVEAVTDLLPAARVHHLGLYREKSTLFPVEYYNKLPSECSVDLGIVLDPIIATSGTAISAVNILKDWGLKRIKLICLLASKEGLQALRDAHPDIIIYVAAIDEVLNDHGYVVPGMGDAGDRLFKTFHD